MVPCYTGEEKAVMKPGHAPVIITFESLFLVSLEGVCVCVCVCVCARAYMCVCVCVPNFEGYKPESAC